MGLVDLHSNAKRRTAPARPQWIVAVQEASTIERQKLAALLAESRMLRQTAATSQKESHIARQEVIAVIEKLIASSHRLKAGTGLRECCD